MWPDPAVQCCLLPTRRDGHRHVQVPWVLEEQYQLCISTCPHGWPFNNFPAENVGQIHSRVAIANDHGMVVIRCPARRRRASA